jgi:hypothetical protein
MVVSVADKLPENAPVLAVITYLWVVLPSTAPTVFDVGYTPVVLAIKPLVECRAAFTVAETLQLPVMVVSVADRFPEKAPVLAVITHLVVVEPRAVPTVFEVGYIPVELVTPPV